MDKLKAIIRVGGTLSGKRSGSQQLNGEMNRGNSPYYYTKQQIDVFRAEDKLEWTTGIEASGHKITTTLANRILTTSLLDANDNVISYSSVELDEDKDIYIVSGEYDSQTESIIFTYNNGHTISVSISSLIDSLPSKEDVQQVASDLSAEETRAKGAENALSTRVSTIENDYLKGSDKTELEQAIDALDDRLDDTYNKQEMDLALSGKQNKLTFDSTPTANSSNPVTSEGIKDYVDNNGGKIDIVKVENVALEIINKTVNITKASLGLNNVENTGDSDTPVSGGTEKFTTGGAYTLGQALQNNIVAVNNKLDEKVHIEDGDEITYNGDTVTKVSFWKNLKTGATGTRQEVIHLANGITAGLMSYTDYNQIRTNTSRIEQLEGQTRRLLYTASTNPTQQQIATFVDNYLTSIGITPSAEEYQGIAVVVAGTYHIWHYYDTQGVGWKDDGLDTVSQFTNLIAGIIKGKQADGFVYAENDGTGSVYGWSELLQRVTNLENSQQGEISQMLANSLKSINYDSTNKKLTETNNEDNTTDIVTLATLKLGMELNNVDNTSDLNKPVSTAQQAALDLKANLTDLANYVAKTGDENIAGVKTFTNVSPIVISSTSTIYWYDKLTLDRYGVKVLTQGNTFDRYTYYQNGNLEFIGSAGSSTAGKIIQLLLSDNSDFYASASGIIPNVDYYSYIATTKYVTTALSSKQDSNSKLSSIANNTNVPTTSTGLLKFTNGVASLDTNTYALASALSDYQPLDSDLTAIAALTGTGLLKRTGSNTWGFDTNSYIVANTEITGATKCKITYDSKGLVTGGADLTSLDISTALGYTPADENDIPTNYVTTDTAQTISGTKTLTGGLSVSGRPAGGGDDEGIVVGRAPNNYAGVCLGNPSGIRSVFYLLPNNDAVWRYNNGTSSFDLQHPKKAGTIATTSDLSSYVPITRTVNSKALSSNISLNSSDVGALPNFTLNISHQSAGNPRQVKFLTINYNTAATYFKMSATSCHDNGTSYQFLEDIIIGCTTSGSVVCNVYKYCQQAVTLDGVLRNYGDVFYTIDSTNKLVDFYILCGQWASSQFTPATKIGNTTINYITQYTGAATYYSSGTKIWASGDGIIYQIAGNQSSTVIVIDALTNISGRNISSYTATDTTISGYTVKQIKYGSSITSEAQARTYMKYMTGSEFLPVYNYDYPQYTYFIFSDNSIWKPQYDTTNGMVLYKMKTLLSKEGDQLIEGTSSYPLILKGIDSDSWLEFQNGSGTTLGRIGVNSNNYLRYNNGSNTYNVTMNLLLNGVANNIGPSFYAPTTAGTSNYILKSNGSGAPTWINCSVNSTWYPGTNTNLGSIVWNGTRYAVVPKGTTSSSYDTATAIGYSSYAQYGQYATAVGYNARAGVSSQTIATGGTALGYYAQAKYAGAIAIGCDSYGTGVSGPNTASYTHIGYNYTSTGRGLALGVNGTGYCYMNAAGSSWASASDLRDKADIEPLKNSLNFILSLKPRTYRMNNREDYMVKKINEETGKTYVESFDREGYKNETKKKHRKVVGLIAQELYQSMIDYFNDDNYMDIVDWTGYDHPEEVEQGIDQYSVQYERLVPVLIKAIQELNDKLEKLKKE